MFLPVHGSVHQTCDTVLISLLLPVVKLGENDYIYVTIKRVKPKWRCIC